MGVVIAKYYLQEQMEQAANSLVRSRLLEGLSQRTSQDEVNSSLASPEAEMGKTFKLIY